MWAETDESEEQRLIKGAEKLVADRDAVKVRLHSVLPCTSSDYLRS